MNPLRGDAMQTFSNARPLLRLRSREAAMPFDHEEAVAICEAPADAPEPFPSIDSMSLLRGGKSVQIAHNGSLYLLQTTKLGKLILTK